MGPASSLVTPFFNTTGTFSTKSLASFRPKSVKVLTSFMILIFAAASKFSSLISNAVFSAALASADADPDPAAADPAELGAETAGPYRLRPILRRKRTE
ncbi:hypothetical protein TorRG33x02_033360 [Trema orientale]|uniref:Uncharacterized protein n=1 Tax=Trema orientale TaxID=63057 RepID=A0A2P5FSC1_TREOI|nr:hypothetical protein TorRG33x02_033360 [Trema orientale]